MSLLTMSMTAPQCSEEDYEAEQGTLTRDERYQVYLDVRGWSALPRKESPLVMRTSQSLFHEALESMRHHPDYHDYERALRQCPHLVESESPAPLFLRLAQFDAWAAACHRIHYWKWRVKLFGAERAYLPLTCLTGQGVLTRDEVHILRQGGVMLLPPDATGRTCIYFHKQILAQYPQCSMLSVRFVFYLVNQAILNEQAQRVS
jgi:hypothetical protein